MRQVLKFIIYLQPQFQVILTDFVLSEKAKENN